MKTKDKQNELATKIAVHKTFHCQKSSQENKYKQRGKARNDQNKQNGDSCSEVIKQYNELLVTKQEAYGITDL